MNSIFQRLAVSLPALRKAFAVGVSASAMLLFAASAQANSFQNGSFEQTTGGSSGELNFGGFSATGWTTTGYNFLYNAGTADVGGSGPIGQYGTVILWGPNSGSANGLPASSPDGGNFVAADGAFEVGPITQTITGLTPGKSYTVGFWWAGAQQQGFTGANTEQWVVDLGSDPTQSTSVYNNTTGGFSGWQYQSFDFTANGGTEVLSFLAVGTPAGVPPFSLLDGVTFSQEETNVVPEPATLPLIFLGLIAGLGFLRSRNWLRAS